MTKMNKNPIVKICLSVTIIALLFETSIIPAFGNNINFYHNSISSLQDISDIPESHLIEGVPYVGQTLGYCAFASMAMMLNKFDGVNVTLNDVIYYTGIGYSLVYPSIGVDRIPAGGIYVSQQTEDILFLTSLFGVTSKGWHADYKNKSDDECWPEYWIRLKQNISNDYPIMTAVNPFRLSSALSLIPFKVPNWLLDKLESGHGIVVFGYNETNGTICYHDPMPNAVGKPECGTHQWMKISDFRTALETVFTGSQDEGATKYLIGTYRKLGEPLSKQEAFNKSHKRNIEKLRGNLSAYDSFIIKFHNFSNLGINASHAFKNHLEKGVNSSKTITIYKKQGKLGILYCLKKLFLPILSFLIKLTPNAGEKFYQTNFEAIAEQKQQTAKFLNINKNLSDICEYEALLFENEAKLWESLASCYSVFMRRGIFLSNFRATFIVSRMNNIMGKVLEIEETITNLEEK